MNTQERNELERKIVILLNDFKQDKTDIDLTCLSVMALMEKEIKKGS